MMGMDGATMKATPSREMRVRGIGALHGETGTVALTPTQMALLTPPTLGRSWNGM